MADSMTTVEKASIIVFVYQDGDSFVRGAWSTLEAARAFVKCDGDGGIILEFHTDRPELYKEHSIFTKEEIVEQNRRGMERQKKRRMDVERRVEAAQAFDVVALPPLTQESPKSVKSPPAAPAEAADPVRIRVNPVPEYTESQLKAADEFLHSMSSGPI